MRDNWRWHLDPRDPDYLEPPNQEELVEAGEDAIDAKIAESMEDDANNNYWRI